MDDKIEKLKKQDSKLRKALEAGARMVEMSTSKLAWDKGHDRIKIVSGKLDYRMHQILDCVADKIAQHHWFGQVLGFRTASKEPDRYMVIVEGHEFKNFVRIQNLTNKYLIKIFKEVPKIVLDGATKIPPYKISENKWLDIHFFEDNICGVAVAYERDEFKGHRSDYQQRGKGADVEEPVFIFLFSNPYGLAFFRSAMKRRGMQIQDPKLYRLSSKAQELFQAVRWRTELIAINTEQASKMMNLKWPVKSKSRLYERVNLIRKMLKILKDNEFINYNDKMYEVGEKIEKKAWTFYARKKKLIKIGRKIN